MSFSLLSHLPLQDLLTLPQTSRGILACNGSRPLDSFRYFGHLLDLRIELCIINDVILVQIRVSVLTRQEAERVSSCKEKTRRHETYVRPDLCSALTKTRTYRIPESACFGEYLAQFIAICATCQSSPSGQ